ncbi:glycosyltransferase family 4 protein [Poseidonocella sp. HB161398]|uniref:glycosyltransferase family 4 protein n=1 Tax=Poseidonocella sp. HB161398 TaxID=2320855 RepID=UPI001109DC6A|nr:glycosyltransferase family 4 protein [Poseidonocella sp. HB161398]
MTLAVATSNPMAVAETYIRQHMRLIAPGRTVAIGLDCPEATALDLPLFCVRRGPGGAAGKALSLARRWRTGYGAALSLAEERRLAEFLRAHGVEAVLAEFGTTGAALRMVCRRAGLPLFVNFHGYDATVLPKRRDIRACYRLLAAEAAGVICGSEHFAGILRDLGFPAAKISVIPCGIELEGFCADGAKDPDLAIAVGRLTAKKRPDLTIRAFAEARRSRPNLRLEVIGDGGQRGRCDAVIAELGLGGAVTMLGACTHEEVKARLAGAGLFLQHSVTAESGDQESQGISLLEAMASGLPVICTDHNGFSETVIEGETGFLSPEHDIPAMAANIRRVTADPELARRLGQAGRARVERLYGADSLAARLRGLILGQETAAPLRPAQLAEAAP